MFQVNVSPDMAMYHLLRSQGYDPAYALAEFIDNALAAFQEKSQSRQRGVTPLRVAIDFFSHMSGGPLRNSIVISDDGPGISQSILPKALKPAHRKDAKGLSEFGIGMKAAAVWFADAWSLITRPTSDSSEYRFTFDLEALLTSGRDFLQVDEVPSKKSLHGTEITLINLRRPIDRKKYDEICETLSELYQRFTAGAAPLMQLVASFDGTPKDLKFIPPVRKILSAPVHKLVGKQVYAIGAPKNWSVAISTVFNGALVEGYIGLLEKGSYDNPGLVLFRHNRVISGTRSNPNIPRSMFGTSNKYAAQRVYGELHLDSLPVSYTKDKFEIDEVAFVEQLKSDIAVQALLVQAEAYRVNQQDVTAVDKESDILGRGERTAGGKPKPSDDPASPNAGAPSAQPPSSTKPSSPGAPAPQPSPDSGKPASGASGKPDKERGKGKDVKQRSLVTLLQQIEPKARSLALASVINETISQCTMRRDIGAALCMRLVLELGLMTKIEADLPEAYQKVSDKGIAALLKYMLGNSDEFFDKRADHKAFKCLQSLLAGGQAEVVLLNNVAHGHYQPSRDELDRLANNLEPLIRWAFL